MESIIPFQTAEEAKAFYLDKPFSAIREKAKLEEPNMDNFRGAVDMAALAAVSVAQAVEDVRYYINGVFLNPVGKGQQAGSMVATNGHTMNWIGKSHVVEGRKNGEDLILQFPSGRKNGGVKKFPQTSEFRRAPKEFLAKEYKSNDDIYFIHRNIGFLFLDEDNQSGSVLIDLHGKAWPVLMVQSGKFPDYTRVVPTKLHRMVEGGKKGKSDLSFNAGYVADACQAAKLLNVGAKFGPSMQFCGATRDGHENDLVIMKWCGCRSVGTYKAGAFSLIMSMRL